MAIIRSLASHTIHRGVFMASGEMLLVRQRDDRGKEEDKKQLVENSKKV